MLMAEIDNKMLLFYFIFISII